MLFTSTRFVMIAVCATSVAFGWMSATADAQFVDPIGVPAIAAYEGTQIVIDTGAVDGNELKTWIDQSITGSNSANNVSGAISRRPTLVPAGLNRRNTVSFNRADAEALFFDASPDFNTSEYSYFAVAKFSGLDGTPNVFRVGDTTSNANWGPFAFGGDKMSFHGRGSAFVGANTPDGTVTTDQWYILTGVLDGTAVDPTQHSVFGQLETLDGSSVITASASDPGGITFGDHVRSTIGSGTTFGGGDWFDGQIAELVIYNVALEEPDQIAVQSYLRAKYIPEPGSSFLFVSAVLGAASFCRRNAN